MLLISFLKKNITYNYLTQAYFYVGTFTSNLSVRCQTNTSNHVLHSPTYSKTSLPAAFAVGPQILQREKYPCNAIRVGDVRGIMLGEPTL